MSCCQAARAMSRAEASIGSRHVGELGLGHRVVGKRAVAELAGGGEGDGLVERAAGETERGGADGDAEQVQGLHGDLEAFALGPERARRGRRRT